MSYSMTGGTGMGSAGTGMGSTPMMPGGGGGLSPQVLAMLRMMMAGQQTPTGGGAAVPGAPGPMNMPPTGTPMAGYIGAGGNPGAMARPMMPPQVGQPPGMQGAPGGQQMPQGGMLNPQTLQMLQMLKGQQSGVPAAGALPAGDNPMAGASPGWLQMLLAHLGGAPNVPQTGAGGFT